MGLQDGINKETTTNEELELTVSYLFPPIVIILMYFIVSLVR